MRLQGYATSARTGVVRNTPPQINPSENKRVYPLPTLLDWEGPRNYLEAVEQIKMSCFCRESTTPPPTLVIIVNSEHCDIYARCYETNAKQTSPW
jgi:hypothetical protein